MCIRERQIHTMDVLGVNAYQTFLNDRTQSEKDKLCVIVSTRNGAIAARQEECNFCPTGATVK